MNALDSTAKIFDVFLCHNTADKPAVREIARMLIKEGIKPATMQEATEGRLIVGGGEQTRSGNAISESRLYPRLREAPDPDNGTQLSILRKRVMEYWVD